VAVMKYNPIDAKKKEEGREHNNMKKEEAQAKAPQYCPILTIV
jgi:hypothetical protein